MHDTPPGARFDLMTGQRVLDLDISPDGSEALVVVASSSGKSEVLRWDFTRPPNPHPELSAAEGTVRELSRSPFDDTAYLVETGSFGARIVPANRNAQGSYLRQKEIYTSRGIVSHVRVPFTLYDSEPRLFFADTVTPTGAPRILSITTTGERRYELTSPTGALSQVTAPELRVREDSLLQPPRVAKAGGAWPISINPRSGTLAWTDLRGRLWMSTYDKNWAPPRAVEAATGSRLSFSPNGAYSLLFVPGEKGALIQLAGRLPTRVCDDVAFLLNPAIAPSGKTLVGLVEADGHHRLVSCAVDVPLADVSFLDDVTLDPARRDRLASHGLSVQDTDSDHVWGLYEESLYLPSEESPPPQYASIDAFVEVLAAGLRAALAQVEQSVSPARLSSVTQELERAASARRFARIAGIASETRRILEGDYSTEEGQRVRAAREDTSRWHGRIIDFGATRPLGIYASTRRGKGPDSSASVLANYYRAFTYLNFTVLTPEETRALAEDAGLVRAVEAWRESARAFIAPASRQLALVGTRVPKAPYLLDDCIPARLKEAPPRLFPLAWGLDSEILESTLWRIGAADRCSVPGRLVPQGLDLLAGLGSKAARRRLAGEERATPALTRVHDDLSQRFAGPLPSDGLYDDWLRLVQLLASDENVPAGVSPERWQARLLETSLGAWVSLRHTTVLFNEVGAAECGGVFEGFEALELEPPRGVVDPLPDAWRQVALLLERLEATTRSASSPLADVLRDARLTALAFGSMAERQIRGEPLSEDEYERIATYAGVVEHPIVKLEGSDTGGAAVPTPLAKVVPIMHVGEGDNHWHVALGRPRRVTVVLHDRGQRSAATGAWYSYFEHVGPRLDDAAWRDMVGQAKRPAWVTVDE